MIKNLVSVLVPVYNGEKYLLEFLNSIKEQTYPSIQIIIRDDCSTDNSYAICENWLKENKKYISKHVLIKGEKNVGLCQNISLMAQYAEGGFIFLADQDDVWKANKIEYQVEYMKKHPKCIISLSDRSITDDKLNVVIEASYKERGYKIETMDFNKVIMYGGIYAANTMCIRNGNYNIWKIPEEVVSHDTFVTIMASYYGTINFIFEPLLFYRIHGKNLSSNYAGQFSRNFLECFFRYLRSSKRSIKSLKSDGKIIASELKKRFGIELEEYPNGLLADFNATILRYTWNLAIKDYKNGKIGLWCKKKNYFSVFNRKYK